MSMRILLIKPSSLGDIIHALPVLYALREKYPDATIDWLVNDGFAPMIRDLPAIDNVVLFERKRFSKVGRSLKATSAFFQFLRSLREVRYNLVIDLQGLFRSGFMTFATGARQRVGFKSAREGAWVFYNRRVPTPRDDLHAVDRNLLLLETLGCDANRVRFDLALTDVESRKAETLLADFGIDRSEQFVAILPGARWETKRWAPERFVELLQKLDQDGARCVLLGGPDERDLCGEIAEKSSTNPPNLAGQTSLRELAAVLSRASVVLTHDSGPMHIADALGRPLVAICGPTNPARTGPYHQRDAVMQADLPCVPCYLKHLHQCPYDHECMRTINVANVAKKVVCQLETEGCAG